MKLLAIECSTEACSVALAVDALPVTECFELAERSHTQRLLPMIEELMQQSGLSLRELDGIAYGRGPGSFTGLRIALATAQGLAFGARLPLVPVSTLAALAQTAVNDGLAAPDQPVLACLDARMDEIYWALFEVRNGLAVLCPSDSERLSAPENLRIRETSQPLLVGSGASYRARFGTRFDDIHCRADVYPRASALLKLASRSFAQAVVPADQAELTYLRDEVAWQKS